MLEIEIKTDKLKQVIDSIAPTKKELNHGLRLAGQAVADAIKATLKAQGSAYYDDAASNTESKQDNDGGVTIKICKRGIGIHWVGSQEYLNGPIEPTKQTSLVTGKPIQNLAIPTENAPTQQAGHGEYKGIHASGFQMGDLKFIPLKGGKPNVTGVLVLDDSAVSKSSKRTRNKLKKSGVGIGKILYILCKYVHIEPTPGILPTEDEMGQAAAMKFVDSILQARTAE